MTADRAELTKLIGFGWELETWYGTHYLKSKHRTLQDLVNSSRLHELPMAMRQELKRRADEAPRIFRTF